MTASDKLTVFLELLFGLPMLAAGILLTLSAWVQLLGWWLK